MGFGVENIFRLLRVDYWRLTHRSRRRTGHSGFRRQFQPRLQILSASGTPDFRVRITTRCRSYPERYWRVPKAV